MGRIKFSIDTLGCKVNQSESDFISEELQKRGMEPVTYNKCPDFCIVNTCTVTSQADRKVRQLIRKIKSENKNSRVIVTGCFVVFNRKFLKKCGVDFIVSNKDKHRIPDLIADEITRNISGSIAGSASADSAGNIVKHSRPLVKVQDGCEQNCTYCIVPAVRGKYKSTPFNAILERITELENDGFEEIVLTGIHIGKYGVDFKSKNLSNTKSSDLESLYIKGKTGSLPRKNITSITSRPSSLAELLERILEETDIKRIRISSIEVNEITGRFIDVLKRNEARIAPHLHIPLQSGSDRILKLMGRPYNSKYYLKKIDRIKEIFPDIAITTDVMVGFPGERDDDFSRTISVVKEASFSKIHVFKYSPREHTAAYMMPGQVSEEVKSSRSVILRNLGNSLRRNYLENSIGKVLDVVCEEISSCSVPANSDALYIEDIHKIHEESVYQDFETIYAEAGTIYPEGGGGIISSGAKGNNIVVSGTSGNYIKVYFKTEKSKFPELKGKIVEVTADSIYKNGLFGILN
jgi:threonylcarbamoyladenosine tRNA methylthiotransferase MtaB